MSKYVFWGFLNYNIVIYFVNEDRKIILSKVLVNDIIECKCWGCVVFGFLSEELKINYCERMYVV